MTFDFSCFVLSYCSGAFIIRPGPIGPHRRCGMYGWPICFLLCPFLLLISLGLAAIDYMCTVSQKPFMPF